MKTCTTPNRWPLIALLLSLSAGCGGTHLTAGTYAPGEGAGAPWEGALLEVTAQQQAIVTLQDAEPVTTTLELLPEDQWVEIGNTPLGKGAAETYRMGENPLVLPGIILEAPRLVAASGFVVLVGTDSETDQAIELYFDRQQ